MVGTPERAQELLAEYYALLPNEFVRDDTNALLGAIVLELRAQRLATTGVSDISVFMREREQDEQTNESAKPEYDAQNTDISDEWTTVEFDHTARAIVVRNFDQPIWVAFRNPDDKADVIPLDPAKGDEPHVFSPPGFKASKLWVRRAEGASDTTANIEAY